MNETVLHEPPLGLPPDGWHLIRLDKLTTKIGSGATPKGGSESYLPARQRYALIRSQNVFDNHFDTEGLAFISDEQAAALRGAEVRYGDLLLNITGDGVTFGRVCSAPERSLPACVNQHVTIIRVDPSRCIAGYLLGYLTLPRVKKYIESFNAGGSRRAITKGHISSFLIPLPPLREQIQIAEVVDSINDKIEQNRRTGAKLEGLARAMFKAWFVDFEPVKAKAAGATSFPGMPPETFATLPSKFDDSSLGPVPLGWRVQAASEVINRLGVGKKFDKKTVKLIGKIPVLDQSGAGFIGYHDENAGVEANLENPVVTFANHTCNMRLLHYPFSTIQNVLPFVGNGVDTLWVYFGLLGRQKFIEYKGHWPDLMILPLAVPPEILSNNFADSVRPLIKLICALERESTKLAALRDYLLPRLLSGGVRVGEAAIQAQV